jgi:vacuolar-type H+-ATPase subunit I/STV1
MGSHDMVIRVIKMIDIFILGNLYLFFGVLVSSAINKYIAKPYDPKKSKLRNFLQLIYETGVIMVSVYLIRILVKHGIPNPLDGIQGFDSRRVSENNGGVVLAFAFLMYMKDAIKSKVDVFYEIFKKD